MKRAIWVTTEAKSNLEKRLLILNDLGFAVELVSNLKELFKLCQTNRPSFVLLSELKTSEETSEAIKDLSKNHDTKGAKFIFITSSHTPKHLEQCAFYAFRGILSMDLPDNAWKEHMSFFSGSNKDPMPFFSARLTVRHLCELIFPARTVWIAKDRLRLETAVCLNQNEKVVLEGPIPELLGSKSLELKVLTASRTHLMHRFSFGYELDLSSISALEQQKLAQKLSQIQKIKPKPIRLFSIIKSHDLRTTVGHLVEDDRFEITSALKISNMIDEPHFIAPDVILIEDFFLGEKYLSKLKQMAEKTPWQTKMLIIARHSKLEAIKAFTAQTPGHQIQIIDTKMLEDGDFKEKLLQDFKNVFQSQELYFDRSDAITCHRIITKGHLRSVHPLHLSVSSVHGIAAYSYFQVSSPLLEKSFQGPIWAKSRACYEDPTPDDIKDGYLIEGYMSTSKQEQREELARLLLKILEKHLSEFVSLKEAVNQENDLAPSQEKLEKNLAPSQEIKARQKKEQQEEASSKQTALAAYAQAYPLSFNLFKILAVIIILWLFFFHAIPFAKNDLQRSGKVFTEQLEIFKKNN